MHPVWSLHMSSNSYQLEYVQFKNIVNPRNKKLILKQIVRIFLNEIIVSEQSSGYRHSSIYFFLSSFFYFRISGHLRMRVKINDFFISLEIIMKKTRNNFTWDSNWHPWMHYQSEIKAKILLKKSKILPCKFSISTENPAKSY